MFSYSVVSATAFIHTADWLSSNPEFLTPRELYIINQEEGDGLVANLTTVTNLERFNYKADYRESNNFSLASLPRLSVDLKPQIIGSLYHLAAFKAPKLEKAWLRLAEFCWNSTNLVDRNILTRNYNLAENSPEYNLLFYCFHRHAVAAYEKFLNLTDKSSSGVIIGTLRLVKLFVENGDKCEKMRELLISSLLKNTPTQVWVNILPQLLARVVSLENHEHARTTIISLLQKIAENSPELIIFAALERKHDFLLNTIENTKTGHKLMREVKMLIEQLTKMAFLWNELWMAAFVQIKVDLGKSLKQLEQEEVRLKKLDTLDNEERNRMIGEQIKAIMRPILTVFEDVNKNINEQVKKNGITSNHEKWFNKFLQPMIDQALLALTNPLKVYPENCSIKKVWSLFKAIQDRLKKIPRDKVHLKTIAPKLVELQHTDIPLPGKSKASGNLITLDKIGSNVNILSSKTKPKKFTFMSSNGKSYHYLFKFQEDLHLDERVMQMLSVVNRLFLAEKPYSQGFKARNYAVTPLSQKSGLIEWVDQTLPLYNIYRSHQQNISKNNKTEVKRPIEVFQEAVVESGINMEAPRKSWNQEKLLKIHDKLVKSTPKDLLSREIWLLSPTSMVQFYRKQAISRSCAVASMLGYIIGLGDRHLDNVLVDMKTSEFVHIDYNVCFEKGQRFKIPETVPFRLTQNITHAIEMSLFKNSASDTLNILKLNSETLLTLLDAFLYDPIFDWTLDIENEQFELAKKKNDEKAAIDRVIFASRLAEIRFSWNDNRIKLIVGLQKLLDKKQEFSDSRLMTNGISQKLDRVKNKYGHVLSDIRSKHYNQILEKFSNYKTLKTEVFNIQGKISELVNNCDKIIKCSNESDKIQTHKYLTWLINEFDGVNNPQNICSQITREFTPVVRDALTRAGKDDLIEKLVFCYNQIRILFQQFQKSSKEVYKYLKIWYDNTHENEKHRCKLWLKYLKVFQTQFQKKNDGQFTFPEVELTKAECFAATSMYEKELKPIVKNQSNSGEINGVGVVAPAQVVLRHENWHEIISIANNIQTAINEKANQLKQLQKQGKEPSWYKRTFKMLVEDLDETTLAYIVQSLVKQLVNLGPTQEDKQLLRFLLSQEKMVVLLSKSRQNAYHEKNQEDDNTDFEELDKVSKKYSQKK